ncbi:hypothetical protein Tco_1494839, partial [Tanacetum coccineum]
MNGINNPELIKEKPQPWTVEKATQTTGHRNSPGDNPMTREILATEGANFPRPPPMRTPEEQRVGNGYCEYHRQKGHTTNEKGKINKGAEARKTHLETRLTPSKQKVSQKFSHGSGISFPTLTADNAVVEPLTIEINAVGHDIHRMYIDGGASADILYEHCFQRLRPEVKSQLNPATTSLTGFTGEKIWPMGQIRLPVMVGNKEHSTTAWMNFMVIHAVPSTAHRMLKFPVDGGIVTIYNIAAPPKECNTVAIHPDYPEQEVSIGGSLSDTGRAAVCALLQRNLDIFAWELKHMTGVPRSITEHKLKIRQGYSPVRQKKHGQAPERAKAILEEVHKLVEAGIMREVYYHDWLSNPVMIASTSFAHLSKQVLVEILKNKSISEMEISTVIEEQDPTWMTPIIEFISTGTLPHEQKDARRIRRTAQRFELRNGVLYRRSFLQPWLRCVGPIQADYVLREIHAGSC